MLELKRLREQGKEVSEALNKRGVKNASEEISKILEVDNERRRIQQEHDELLSRSNQLAKQIGGLMKEGKKEEAEMIKVETGKLKGDSKRAGEELRKVESMLNDLLSKIPNAPSEKVPAGTNENDNDILETNEGRKPSVSEPLPHWEITSKLGIIDFELGNKITGAGFPVYMGQGARLQRALVQFFLDKGIESGYKEILPPILVSRDSAFGTGQLPDKDGQMYTIHDDELFVIPTAEVPITNILRGDILDESDLPTKFIGYTPCFRREAGSWGSHVRGLNRLHQFDKVEIVQAIQPEHSAKALDEMCDHVSGLLGALELPYRLLRLCGGDLGFAASETIDFEVFSSAQDRWLEVSSVSNFGSFQSNRMKTRYRDSNKKVHLIHTLNGSALALPRVLAGILENFQDARGVEIPSALRSYLPFERMDYPS